MTGKLTPKLDEFAKFYGQKDYALGYLTLADFHIVEASYHIEKIFPQVYAKYPFLKRVRTVFENLPEIRRYYDSDKAVKAPFFSPQAAIKFWFACIYLFNISISLILENKIKSMKELNEYKLNQFRNILANQNEKPSLYFDKNISTI